MHSRIFTYLEVTFFVDHIIHFLRFGLKHILQALNFVICARTINYTMMHDIALPTQVNRMSSH
jgi:hypothetical protein